MNHRRQKREMEYEIVDGRPSDVVVMAGDAPGYCNRKYRESTTRRQGGRLTVSRHEVVIPTFFSYNPPVRINRGLQFAIIRSDAYVLNPTRYVPITMTQRLDCARTGRRS